MDIKMKMNEIFDIIRGERTHQKEKWGYRTSQFGDQAEYDDYIKSVGEYILYMEHHLHQARMKASTQDNHDGALDELRKVAALAVACFEQHGVPERKL